MTREQAAIAIAKAVSDAHAAYWSACDTEHKMIDPADLNAPEGLLDEAQAEALLVEYLAQERGISWAEARKLA